MLTYNEVLAWVSDSRRQMRRKAEILIGKLDKNGDGALSVSEEIVPNLNFFKYYGVSCLTLTVHHVAAPGLRPGAKRRVLFEPPCVQHGSKCLMNSRAVSKSRALEFSECPCVSLSQLDRHGDSNQMISENLQHNHSTETATPIYLSLSLSLYLSPSLSFYLST
eukprot:sb/3472607/